MKRRIRTYSELTGEDVSGLPDQIRAQLERVEERLSRVRHLVGVMSGKGGVGKSFVAAGLAVRVASEGRRVGLLDADLSAPTVGRMLGGLGLRLSVGDEAVEPPTASGVRFVSTALLLEGDRPLRWREPEEESFVWRGATERGVLREFLSDVAWGELDLLLVDLPPGGSRLEELAGLAPGLRGILGVTLPSEASRSAVERSLHVAEERDAPILGIVENMSGYACEGCGSEGALFPGDGGEALARRFGAPLLARVPFDPRAARLADEGRMDELLEGTSAGEGLRMASDAMWDELEAT